MNLKRTIKGNIFKESIIIDIGSQNTKMLSLESHRNIKEKTCLSLENYKNYQAVTSVGDSAYKTIGENKNSKVEFPIKKGKITNIQLAETLIKLLIEKFKPEPFYKINHKILIIYPNNLTDNEILNLKRLMSQIGARETIAINSLIASSIGIGVDIGKDIGTMVVDMGHELTQCGIIKLNQVVNQKTFEMGGYDIEKEIIQMIKEKYHMVIGFQTAEKIKKEVGFQNEDKRLKVIGKDIIKGTPIEKEIKYYDIYVACLPYLNELIRNVTQVFHDMPEELAKDIHHTGMFIIGGYSQIPGIKDILEAQTGVNVTISENPNITLNGAKKAWQAKNRSLVNYEN